MLAFILRDSFFIGNAVFVNCGPWVGWCKASSGITGFVGGGSDSQCKMYVLACYVCNVIALEFSSDYSLVRVRYVGFGYFSGVGDGGKDLESEYCSEHGVTCIVVIVRCWFGILELVLVFDQNETWNFSST